MYEGCSVELWMEQMILEEGELEERIHYCKVIGYDENKERIQLLLRGEEVDVISLDAIYGCKLMDGEKSAECEGMILERYMDKLGNMLVFQIENGFYKNNLN
ncbi:MAG: hypothetical protein Q4C52_09565 [Eubacteriales bacterium]|nr:hypothetical protein [Eubacteriales bacterium]